MRQAIRIALVGLVELGACLALSGIPAWFFGWVASCTLIVSAAVALGWTPLLGKREDGTLAPWSLPLFWPWHLAVRSSAKLVRRIHPPFTEVHPGWWVGGWPHRHREPAPWQAILDLTCELPRRQQGTAYLNLPTWDATSPTIEALERGAAWLCDRHARGESVLVHCAAGRGRSVTVLCAALVRAGLHANPDEAFAHVQRLRPFVRLQPSQRVLLAKWSAERAAALPTSSRGA